MRKRIKECKWLFLLLMVSCQDLVVEEHIVGNYYVVATDMKNEKHLSYATGTGGYVGITPGCTFAIAYNNKYIVAKQSPDMDNATIVNYYIHERQNVKAGQLKTDVEGPLYEEVYEGRKLQLEKYGPLEFENVD